MIEKIQDVVDVLPAKVARPHARKKAIVALQWKHDNHIPHSDSIQPTVRESDGMIEPKVEIARQND